MNSTSLIGKILNKTIIYHKHYRVQFHDVITIRKFIQENKFPIITNCYKEDNIYHIDFEKTHPKNKN